MNLKFPPILAFLGINKVMLNYALLFLVLLFKCFSVNAQKIYYTHQDKTLQEIKASSIDWEPYTETIYNGIDNGVYWFKIELELSKPRVLSIPESHISKAQLFYENSEIKKESDTRYVTFILESQSAAEKKYYLKVDCLLEGKIPLEIKDYSSFYKNEMKDYMIIGLYIGIVLCIILFNLFSYITLKNTTYLHYIFMVIGMSINAFYKDGMTALLFGIEGFNETHETTFTSILVISSIFFSTSYLSLNNYLLKLRRVGIVVAIFSILSNIIYQVTLNFTAFITTDILYLLVLDIFWFSGVLLWKKSPDARFFAIAYGIPLLFAHDYYISSHIGIYVFNLPLHFYKVGSVFEMIVFTYAIMYQSKRLAEENEVIREKLLEYTDKLDKQNSDFNRTSTTTEELIEKHGFTIREIEILKKVADKLTNKEIANSLFISENTVKFHIRNILQKLEVKNRKEASSKYHNFNNPK